MREVSGFCCDSPTDNSKYETLLGQEVSVVLAQMIRPVNLHSTSANFGILRQMPIVSSKYHFRQLHTQVMIKMLAAYCQHLPEIAREFRRTPVFGGVFWYWPQCDGRFWRMAEIAGVCRNYWHFMTSMGKCWYRKWIDMSLFSVR